MKKPTNGRGKVLYGAGQAGESAVGTESKIIHSKQLIEIIRVRIPELHIPPGITRLEIVCDIKDAARVSVEFFATRVTVEL